MILVICGAGASYDSVTSLSASRYDLDVGSLRSQSPYRPPLASELFIPDNPLVNRVIRLFPQCHAILPYLQAPADGVTIENTLEQLQNEGEEDRVRKRQLAAIRYYLQSLISQFEQNWRDIHGGVTNYGTMIDQLRRTQRSRLVCLVTFNYDCMIEDALLSTVGIKTDSLDDYVSNPNFKLFKLHGSIDWFHALTAPFSRVDPQYEQTELIKELIRRADEIEFSGEFRIRKVSPIGRMEHDPVWPAIAIPVTTKLIFECPEDHVQTLKSLLPETERIITIGWRGAESHFLKMLADAGVANKLLPMLPIAGDKAGAQEVVGRFDNAGIHVSGVFDAQDGFSNTIVARTIENFCKA